MISPHANDRAGGAVAVAVHDRNGAGFECGRAPLPPKPLLVAAAAAAVAAAVIVGSVAGTTAMRVTGRSPRTLARHGLLTLPAGAQGPVSAALGRDNPVFRIVADSAHNPAQRLSARFRPAGVTVTAGGSHLRIALRAVGRGEALRPVGQAAPSHDAADNRIDYGLGSSVKEWWTNGPLGLEQGFDVARRPLGVGALTLSLAISGPVALEHGALSLAGGLRYTGLRAQDAGGRALPARFELRNGRVLIIVDDRGARYPVHVDPFVQSWTLTPDDYGTGGGSAFGYSVAISGTTIAVGAPDESDVYHYEGAVYAFVRTSAGAWESAAKMTATTSHREDDELGYSVAVSGRTIVAGAPNATAADGYGAVYLFNVPSSGWPATKSPSAELTASDQTPLAELGASVAIDGTTVVAGAPGHAIGSAAPGAVYVFDEPDAGWHGHLSQSSELTAGDGSGGDQLGTSVGISETTTNGRSGGLAVVAGAPGHTVGSNSDQGAVYVWGERLTYPFGWDGGSELTVSNGAAGDQLGSSVAISGNTVVAGAPNATALVSCGRFCARLENGIAFVFVKPTDGGWGSHETALLEMSDGHVNDAFGRSVAIEGDTIVVGAAQTNGAIGGRTYVFVEPAGGWSSADQTSELTSGGPGYSVAIDGDTIVGGAEDPDGFSSDGEGSAVLFSREDPTIAISSPGHATYGQNQAVPAAYTCTAPSGATITGCAGSVANGAPIDTSAPGPYQFTVTAVDSDGASASHTVSYTVLGPQVTSVDHLAGPSAGGNTITIEGTGFAAGDTVDVGSVPSPTVTYESIHELKAVVPAGEPGVVDVTVTSSDGTDTGPTTPADQYTFDPVPTLTGVDPATGPTAGGNTVTITGTGFVAGAIVDFGSIAATSVTVASSSELEATAPAEAAGRINIRVHTPGGASASSDADRYSFTDGT